MYNIIFVKVLAMSDPCKHEQKLQSYVNELQLLFQFFAELFTLAEFFLIFARNLVAILTPTFRLHEFELCLNV